MVRSMLWMVKETLDATRPASRDRATVLRATNDRLITTGAEIVVHHLLQTSFHPRVSEESDSA